MINKKYMRILFVVYLLVLLKVILFKYPLVEIREIVDSWQSDVLWEGMDRANFEWFRTIKLYTRYWDHKELNSFGNLIGNVLIFIPLGYFLPRLFRSAKSIAVCMLEVLIFVLGVELFQLYTNFGVFDVDDILLNCLGGLLGYILYKITKTFLEKKKSL